MSALDQGSRDLEDKSLFYYGNWYNKLFDPLIRPAREAVVNVISANSSVLDIGCGTGLLCFDLKREKNCQVVGITAHRTTCPCRYLSDRSLSNLALWFGSRANRPQRGRSSHGNGCACRF